MDPPSAEIHDQPPTASLYQSLLLSIGLVLLVALVYLPGLGLLPLEKEEPRRALVTRTMMETGDYLVPRLLGEVYTAKPPLFNWSIAAASAPRGEITEISARLPSVLSVALLAVVMVLGMRHYLAITGQAFLGCAIVLAPELMAKGSLAEIELLFTLLVSASVWAWFWRYDREVRGARLWLLPCLLMALAFLAKGPLAQLFFYLSVVPYLLARRNFRILFEAGHGIALGVSIVLIGAWIAVMVDAVGLDSLIQTVQSEMMKRGSDTPAAALIGHALTYPLKLLAGMFPFSLPLLVLLAPSVRTALRQRWPNVIVFAGLAVTVNLTVYMTRDAAVRYFLPMLPTALVLSACTYDSCRQNAAALTPRVGGALRYAALGVAALTVVAATGWAVAATRSVWGPPAPQLLPVPITLAIAVAAGVLGAWHFRRARLNGLVVLLPAFVVFAVVFRMIYLTQVVPHRAAEAERDANAPVVLAAIAGQLPDGVDAVQVVGQMPRAIYFYAPAGLLVPPSQGDTRGDYFLRFERTGDPVLATDPVLELHRDSYEDGELVLYRNPKRT